MTQPLAEFLVREFTHMANTIAKSEYFKSNGMLDRHDVESTALSALVSAANSWSDYCEAGDHDRTNLSHFSKYASLRIRGDIVDESRKNTFASRWNISDYQKARTVGLEKPVHEISQETGISESRIKNAISAIKTDRSMRMSHELSDDAMTFEHSGIELTLEVVVNIIRSMPKTQQVIIAMKYFLGMKIKDISDELGIKQKIVATLHTDAVLKIRTAVMMEML